MTMRSKLPYEWDGSTPITRADTGLTIHVDGDTLIHYRPKNHLGMGDDARFTITDGPARIGNRWYARSVRQLCDDDGNMWLAGYGAMIDTPTHACTFGSCPDGHAVAWRPREGETWQTYTT